MAINGMQNNREEFDTRANVFHQMGPLVTGRGEHWRGKCDHYVIPHYLDKKYRREDSDPMAVDAVQERREKISP